MIMSFVLRLSLPLYCVLASNVVCRSFPVKLPPGAGADCPPIQNILATVQRPVSEVSWMCYWWSTGVLANRGVCLLWEYITISRTPVATRGALKVCAGSCKMCINKWKKLYRHIVVNETEKASISCNEHSRRVRVNLPHGRCVSFALMETSKTVSLWMIADHDRFDNV